MNAATWITLSITALMFHTCSCYFVCDADRCYCSDANERLSQIGDPDMNGCGTNLFNVDWYVEEFVYECDEHDMCYSTCDQSKTECDTIFCQGLNGVCMQTFSERYEQRRICLERAQLYCDAVLNFGYDAFTRAQSVHCTCSDLVEFEFKTQRRERNSCSLDRYCSVSCERNDQDPNGRGGYPYACCHDRWSDVNRYRCCKCVFDINGCDRFVCDN